MTVFGLTQLKYKEKMKQGVFSMITFENMAGTGMKIYEIERDGVSAKGICIPEAIAMLDDAGISAKGYPDTGVFVLFKGSSASPEAKKKCAQYIDKNEKTTRELVFQSRNAAAQFVLGEKGRTNDWE